MTDQTYRLPEPCGLSKAEIVAMAHTVGSRHPSIDGLDGAATANAILEAFGIVMRADWAFDGGKRHQDRELLVIHPLAAGSLRQRHEAFIGHEDPRDITPWLASRIVGHLFLHAGRMKDVKKTGLSILRYGNPAGINAEAEIFASVFHRHEDI